MAAQSESSRADVAGEYVRGDVSTNQAENFFSQLKRSLDGTHHHVGVPHLDRYLAEFAFRYTYRKESGAEPTTRIVTRTGVGSPAHRQPACSG